MTERKHEEAWPTTMSLEEFQLIKKRLRLLREIESLAITKIEIDSIQLDYTSEAKAWATIAAAELLASKPLASKPIDPPPKNAELILSTLLRGDEREAALGDLIEGYRTFINVSGSGERIFGFGERCFGHLAL